MICRVNLFLDSSSSEELEQETDYPSTQQHFPQWEVGTSCKAEKEMKGARWLKSNLQLPSSSPLSSPLSSIFLSTFFWFYPWLKKYTIKKNGSDSFVSMNTALGPTLRVGPDPQASVAFSVTAHHPPAGSWQVGRWLLGKSSARPGRNRSICGRGRKCEVTGNEGSRVWKAPRVAEGGLRGSWPLRVQRKARRSLLVWPESSRESGRSCLRQRKKTLAWDNHHHYPGHFGKV